jgi:hypothetical protein
MPLFASPSELNNFAEQFLAARLETLEKDTKHCLNGELAPFPAILLCMSSIDLLGALTAGNAADTAPTTKQSKDYMCGFMNYTEDQATLLQKLFRHKLVHLAQPKAAAAYQGKTITWSYWHDDVRQHLKLIKLPNQVTLRITSGLSVTVDHEFSVSISHLVKDVTESVQRPGGYLVRLKTDATLGRHFETAIGQIYSP